MVNPRAADRFNLVSSAFGNGEWIPNEFTREGEDYSPPLKWSGAPEGTKEFALLCEDPDAPQPQPWVHWLLYKIPAEASGLPAGLVPTQEKLEEPAGAIQGLNSFGNLGYGGPKPPPNGPHRYRFRLYALRHPLSLLPRESREAVMPAIEENTIAVAELIGKYQNKSAKRRTA